MKNCPCVDCITFPICKTQVKFRNHLINVGEIHRKCKPFREWWETSGGYDFIVQFSKFFGVK